MAEFDAELYLRLAGETMLLDSRGEQGQAWESPMDVTAHALVAVGALTAGMAQAIVADYYLARSFRSGEVAHFRRHHQLRARQARAAGARPGGGAAAGAGWFRVTLTMIPEGRPPKLTRDPDGIAAELPFGWLADVWVPGLSTCWGRFCLAAAPSPATDGWVLSTVGPDLDQPRLVTIGNPPPAS
ncbi:MAG: hypothetical protein ACLPKI_25635 [Streptosporangiaceae bacterium]